MSGRGIIYAQTVKLVTLAMSARLQGTGLAYRLLGELTPLQHMADLGFVIESHRTHIDKNKTRWSCLGGAHGPQLGDPLLNRKL